MNNLASTLASNLEGKRIKGLVREWIVEKKLKGGGFSSGYRVRDTEGNVAFMKAINIAYAANSTNFGGSGVDLMSQLLDEFKYERDLLKWCGDERMDRIVLSLDSGEYRENAYAYLVPFLIFEFTNEGDMRKHTSMHAPGLAWRLRVFHGVCVGIRQLHSRDVVHQDLKPENVLIFDKDVSKIADLGRSTSKSPQAKFNSPGHCGDFDYAPIELQYKYHSTDWAVRRKAADLYMLAGLLAFLVADDHLVGRILTRLPDAYHPLHWKGSFADALPAIRKATYDAIEELTDKLDPKVKKSIADLLLWLAEPEPEKRGHPDTVAQATGDRFSLERIVTVADRIAWAART
jgi:eukaryotic-like serine/threonine-protein kinase